jgi:hypothetical protein
VQGNLLGFALNPRGLKVIPAIVSYCDDYNVSSYSAGGRRRRTPYSYEDRKEEEEDSKAFSLFRWRQLRRRARADEGSRGEAAAAPRLSVALESCGVGGA